MFNLWTAWNQFSKFKDYTWIVHNGGCELRDFHFEISVKIVIFDHCNSMYTQGKIFSFVVQSSCQASWKHFFFEAFSVYMPIKDFHDHSKMVYKCVTSCYIWNKWNPLVCWQNYFAENFVFKVKKSLSYINFCHNP